MSSKTGLAVLAAAATAVVVSSHAASKSASPPPLAPYAVTFESEDPVPASPARPENREADGAAGDGMASLLVLGAFLSLIGVNLVRWSGDGSCRSRRSVF